MRYSKFSNAITNWRVFARMLAENNQILKPQSAQSKSDLFVTGMYFDFPKKRICGFLPKSC